MPAEDVRDQIVKYVQVLETNYTEVISELKDDVAKNNKKVSKVLATGTNFQVERNELE